MAGGRYLEAVQLLSRMADESAGAASDRGLAGEPGPGTGPVPADSHLLGVRAPRHQPVWRPARRDHDRRADFPVQWLSGPGRGRGSPEINGGLNHDPRGNQRKWRWSIEEHGSGTNRACTGEANSRSPRKTDNSGESGKMVSRLPYPARGYVLHEAILRVILRSAGSKRAESAWSRRSALRGEVNFGTQGPNAGEAGVAAAPVICLQLMSFEESGGRV